MVRPAAGVTLAAALLAAVLTLPGCEQSQGAEATGALVEEPCVGVPVVEARCLRLTVYEDQSAKRGRTITLRIVVLPATQADGARRADDAVVYLAGGPGQAATELIGDSALELAALRSRRDVVYADQRGTGGSNALLCQFYGPPDEPQSYFEAFLPIEKVKACRSKLEATSDLRQYTTSASVEDLEAIRTALEYPQLTLVGGSYGTRLAMEYVRRYEARVRAVILEGPVTPANHVPERFGQLAARALDGVLDECLADVECASRISPRSETKPVRCSIGCVRSRLTAVVSHPSARAAWHGHVDAQPCRRGDSLPDLLLARGVARAALPARSVQRRLLVDRQLPDAAGAPRGRSTVSTCRSPAPRTCRSSPPTRPSATTRPISAAIASGSSAPPAPSGLAARGPTRAFSP